MEVVNFMTAMAADVSTAREKVLLDRIMVHGVEMEKGKVMPMNAKRAAQHARGLMARKYGSDATFRIRGFRQAPKTVFALTNHEHLAEVEVVTGRAPAGTLLEISTFFIYPVA